MSFRGCSLFGIDRVQFQYLINQSPIVTLYGVLSKGCKVARACSGWIVTYKTIPNTSIDRAIGMEQTVRILEAEDKRIVPSKRKIKGYIGSCV
jgi:hypothetical protein